MSELLTAAQMRAIEQAAIASGEVTGLELMERAGRGVVEAILEEWPELAKTSHRAVVLCGPGNNGGDGFVVARLLKQRGWEVEVFLYGDPAKLPPDARVNHERWQREGAIRKLTEEEFRSDHPVHGPAFADIYVDAIFGTGLTRPPQGDLAILMRHFGGFGGDDYASRTVAVDAPSGLCLDSGRCLSASGHPGTTIPRSALTVTFDSPKLGHIMAYGPEYSGALSIKDIGIAKFRERQSPDHRTVRVPRAVLVTGAPLVEDSRSYLWDVSLRLPKAEQTHKYTHGHALILSGPATRTGAARLAARGALRIGAGLVTVAAPAPALAEHAAHLTAIMLREANDAGELETLLEDDRLNALCLGPGMGTGELTRNMVKAALTARRATVLDADALTTFAEDPSALFGMLHETCVLTPHGGEFARLFPDISQRLAEPATTGPAYSKVDATRAAAERAGCTVLFKGADTVIADQTGNCRINSAAYDRAAPWLATAGSGDVLAGFITGLLARGHAPIGAASTAAWLHVECARSFGPGLIAEDIPEELPKVFQHLGL
ncbi:NAD(P)H-hydrate dehydratase [Ovoidimarina sediminis]|uniref:NAD(P)H-hydrate dehydratase n=1 Tax=Ovoidimarina sediminis TaxID=3079856 RepID=UPI0029149ED1|nr:NAD(P)H-hydrate dehydratase [Rhodophyticola sp. MJ-SS7]MDU8943240.1 NAD(P)H-hydrate dehydratase [Rhodophyticola sp. MJ-SS7]